MGFLRLRCVKEDSALILFFDKYTTTHYTSKRLLMVTRGAGDCIDISPVRTTPHQKVKKGFLTLKTRQMFSVQSTPERFENTTITGQIEFEENSGREII